MSETATNPGVDNGRLFARERLRGQRQAEQDILAAAGVTTREELVRLAHEARVGKSAAGKEPAAPADAGKQGKKDEQAPSSDLDKLLEEKLTRALDPILKRYAKDDEDRAALTKKQEAERAKQESEAKLAREAEETAAAAEKQLAKERRLFKKLAGEAGALVKDEDAYEELQALYERRLNRMSEDDFEEKFGEDVDPDDVKKNTLAILGDIRKRAPGLFTAGDTKPPVAAATTGKSTPSPDGKASAGSSAAATTATKRELNVQLLSAKQFREYNADRAGFRKRFEQGLIDYDKK